MELRHLRYFVAAAEERHITRAAERLGIQQPPLSQQIRALEAELGTPLLRRHPRGVELTQAGEALLAEARAVLEQVERAVTVTRRAGRGEAGRIGLGFTSSASFHPLVPAMVRAYRDAFPLVALSLEESGTSELVEALVHSASMPPSCARRSERLPGSRYIPFWTNRWSRRFRPARLGRREGQASAAAGGIGRRNLHPLSPAARARSLRCDHRRLPARRVQPQYRPGGAAHARDAQPCGGRARGDARSAINAPAARARRNLPDHRQRGRARRAAEPGLSPLRDIAGGAAVHGAGAGPA